LFDLSLLIFSKMLSIDPYWRTSFRAVEPPIPGTQSKDTKLGHRGLDKLKHLRIAEMWGRFEEN
jgi:hypothetical protein